MLAIAGLPLDDVKQIFVVLTTLYAIECCWWIRGEARRIFGQPFPSWSDRPGESTTVDAWRLSCSNPWPGGEAYAAQSFPVPFDHTRLLIPQLDAATGCETYRQIAFEELEPIAARGLDVYAGSRRLTGCSSTRCASATATRLERLRASAASDRPAVSEAVLAEIWSLPEARQRLDRWRRDCRTLRLLGGLLAATGGPGGPDSLVAAWFRDALFPARRPSIPADDPLTTAALHWFHDRSAQHARTAIKSTGLEPDDLLIPAAAPPDVRSYCPRCGRQFAVDTATCLACGLASAPLVRR